MKRAVFPQSILARIIPAPVFLASAVALSCWLASSAVLAQGCASCGSSSIGSGSGLGCGSSMGCSGSMGCGGSACCGNGCDTCFESNGDNCGSCCPYPLFNPLIGLARLLGAGCCSCCGHGCSGEIWLGEWRNRCCDPCDTCGNFVGGNGAGPANQMSSFGPYNGMITSTAPASAPVASSCNNYGNGYASRANTSNAPMMANGYAKSRSSVAPVSYTSQRIQTNSGNYAARPTTATSNGYEAGYAAGYAAANRPMASNGEMVGQPKIISVTDEVVPAFRTSNTAAQPSRLR